MEGKNEDKKRSHNYTEFRPRNSKIYTRLSEMLAQIDLAGYTASASVSMRADPLAGLKRLHDKH